MNKLIILYSVTVFSLLPFFSFSQALNVVYDAQSGQIKYYKGEVETFDPMVKKGQPIQLRIENYNNYIFDIDIQETHEEYKLGEGNNPLSGIQGIGFADIVQGGIVDLGDSDGDGVVDMIDREPESWASEEERLIQQLKLEAEECLFSLERIESSFQATAKEVKAFERQEAFKANSLEEVESLKMNPHLPPSKIKNYSTAIIQKALNVESYSEPNLDLVIEQNDYTELLSQMISSLDGGKQKYSTQVGKIDQVKKELLRLAPGRSDLATLYFSMENAILNAPSAIEKADMISEELGTLLEKEEGKNLHETMAIWYEYEAIKSNTFSTSHLSQGQSDLVIFDVTLNRKSSAENTGAQESITLAPIKIPVHGGLKINASVGVNFGQYFNPAKSYFVRDSIIYGQNEDSFLPMVASNLHVYSQSRRIVSVGGTMGIGIPLGLDSGFQSINFFLGPSLFFGQSERFVLNFGVMGGKAKRLSSGYKEGDFFDGQSEFLPSHTPYELGYFMGLSFNLR